MAKNNRNSKKQAGTVKANAKAKAKAASGGVVRGVDTRVKALIARSFPHVGDRVLNSTMRKPYPNSPEPMSMMQFMTRCQEAALLRDPDGGRITPGEMLTIRTVWLSEEASSSRPAVMVATGPGGSELQIKDQNETVNYDLKKAVALSITDVIGMKDRKIILSVLGMLPKINQKECVVVLRSLQTLNVTHGSANAQHVLAVIGRIISRGWGIEFQAELKTCKLKISQALMNLCGVSISKGEDVCSFWRANRQFDKVLGIDLARADALVDARSRGQPLDEESLKILATSSSLMRTLWKKDLAQVLKTSTLKEIKECLDQLYAAANVTTEFLRQKREKMLEKASSIAGAMEGIDQKFELDRKYRGTVPVKYTSRSIFTHVEKSLVLFVRELTSGHPGGMLMLHSENLVLGEPANPTRVNIDNSFFSAGVLGRTEANRLIKRAHSVTHEEVQSTLTYETNNLLGKDKDWDIDAIISKGMVAQTLAALKVEVLKMVPSETRRRTFTEAADLFALLQQSDLWKYSPTSSTGPISGSWAIIAMCRRGQLKKTEYDSLTGFDKEVADSLKWFLVFEEFQAGSLDRQTFLGMEALRKKFDKFDHGSVEPALLVELVQFQFLLAAGEAQKVFDKAGDATILFDGESASSSKKAKTDKGLAKTDLELAMAACENLWS